MHIMEKGHTKSTLKFVKTALQSTATSWSSNSGGMSKDELKEREKYSKSCERSPTATKENTKAQEIILHTQQRASKRAMFNYMVATKLSILERQRKHEEMLQKMIEEEEIRLLRKEMVPRAQLMPFFDRPFIPQRSNRRLTIPKEPSLGMMSSKCFSGNSSGELYHFQPMNPIK